MIKYLLTYMTFCEKITENPLPTLDVVWDDHGLIRFWLRCWHLCCHGDNFKIDSCFKNVPACIDSHSDTTASEHIFGVIIRFLIIIILFIIPCSAIAESGNIGKDPVHQSVHLSVSQSIHLSGRPCTFLHDGWMDFLHI